MKNQVRAMNEKDFVEAQKDNVFQAGVVKLENERGIKMSDIRNSSHGPYRDWAEVENE